MKKKVWRVTVFVAANNKVQAYKEATKELKDGHCDIAEPFLNVADDVLNIGAKLRMGTTYSDVLTELTQYLINKKHIHIKYALPIAEQIIQMVEEAFERCDN